MIGDSNFVILLCRESVVGVSRSQRQGEWVREREGEQLLISSVAETCSSRYRGRI